ncbi:MAG: helix-turn-helix domain-containing protein [Candidatus Sericytochromatia bacterium]|nr:helix-turn-helix domain-containing protein [Candidatus Sericytochromatia bacterium]
MVLLSIREEKTILEIASEYGVDPKSLRDWKKEFLENASLMIFRVLSFGTPN